MFGYGGKNYAIALPEGEGYCYDTVDDVAASINKALKEQQISSGETLGDIIEVSANGGKLEFKDKAGTTNELTLKGGSALEYLGFGPEKDFEEISFAGGSAVSADDIDASKLVSNVDFKEYAAGKEFTFEYNGTTATIKMPEKDQWSTLDDLKSSIQSQMSRLMAACSIPSVHLISTFDSGRSSKELRRAFAIPALGDLRNRLLALADPDKTSRAVMDFLSFRLPESGNRERSEERRVGKECGS